MPLDPSIPLAFKPTVAAESPIATVSHLMQMRGMASEVALRNAQTENIEAQAEGRRAEMNEQNIIRDAMKDPEIAKQIGGGDFSALNGRVSIGTLDKMTKSATDHHKDLATATKTDLENRNTALESIYQSVNGLRSLKDPASINQAIPSLVQQLTADGTFKNAKIDPAQIPTSITSIDDLNQWLASTNLLQGANKAALATKTAEGAAKAPYEKTVTTDKGIMGFNPESGKYDIEVGQAPEKKANAPATITTDKGIFQFNPESDRYDIAVGGAPPKGDSAEARFESEFLRTHPGATIAQAQRANKLNQHIAAPGDGPAVPLNHDQQSIAEKLASGDFDPRQLTRIKNKEGIIAAAIDINPDWTPNSYATKRAFTDPQGKQSQNLGTIARIVEHIGRFESNSAKMGTAPVYAMGYNTSNDASALRTDTKGISAELEKLLAGGVGTEGQTKAWESALNSPIESIRKGAIDEISQLIGGQYTGMNQSYKAGTGKDLPQEQFVSGHGRAWLQKNGINVTGSASGAPAPAQPAAASGGMIEATDDKGVIHHAPAGSALPPGWKLKQK